MLALIAAHTGSDAARQQVGKGKLIHAGCPVAAPPHYLPLVVPLRPGPVLCVLLVPTHPLLAILLPPTEANGSATRRHSIDLV